MSEMKSWFHRNIIEKLEAYLIAAVAIALTVLFLVLMAATRSHATAFLIIEVPPQAVLRVIDGDTFTVFTFAPGGAVKIRVSNVDTPEKKEPKYEEAREFTRTWLSQGSFIVQTCGEYTFERIQATVERDGKYLADALKQAGLTKP